MSSPAATAQLRALALANARYWTTVAPGVRRELARWQGRAAGIADPRVSRLAQRTLAEKRFNALLAATLATLAPRRHRGRVVEAIVALQVAYDYLDALTERAGDDPPGGKGAGCPPAGSHTGDPLTTGDPLAVTDDPLEAGRRAYAPLTALFETMPGGPTSPRQTPMPAPAGCDPYLGELMATVAAALAELPRVGAIAPTAHEAAARCAEAQTLAHAAPLLGVEPAKRWAQAQAARNGLQWQELLAGAQASVLSLHALFAAAAKPGLTETEAQAIDRTYLWIGAVSMLDGLVDRERDRAIGAICHADLYPSRQAMVARLAEVVRGGLRQGARLPDAAHHQLTLAGVIAHYASHPSAGEESARATFAALKRELPTPTTPTLALVGAWQTLARRRACGADAVLA